MVDKYMLRSDFSLQTTTWATATAYKVDQLVHNDGITYVCLLAHTSTANDEPGTGANEATYWQEFCIGATGPQGPTGSDGTAADVGLWSSGHPFATGDRCYHAKTGYGQCVYRCKTGHTSAAANEPEVGASWTDIWELFAGGGQNGAGSGDFVGPASSTTDNLVSFGDTSGKLGKDAGTPKSVVDTVLLAETASTTAPVGTTDKFIVNENGVMKAKSANTMFTRYIPVTITAQAWQPSATSGCADASSVELATNKFNFRSLAFGYASKTYANFKMKLPLAYTGGALFAYFEWHSTGTTSNGVCWGIAMASVGNDESLDAAWGSAVEIIDNATGKANRNLISGVTSAITPSGTPAGGETLEIRIYRDPANGSDNLNEIVYLDDVTILLPVNKQSEA